MEAKDGSSISDFEQAEKEAVTLGATILSNSWSCPENWDCGDSDSKLLRHEGHRVSRFNRR